MTILVLVSALSVLILIFAVRLLVQSEARRYRPSVTADEYANARQQLDSVYIETAIIQRIFSSQDADFIASSATPVVKGLFLEERKNLALRSFRKTRKQVARLMDLHLRLASYTHDPNPRLELRLTANYLSFVVVSNIVLLLLWMLGPFKASRVISYAVRTAASFCGTFSLRLERVNPAHFRSGRESLLH